MAAVAGTAVTLAPAAAGSAHKGAATLHRWSAAAARPAGRWAVAVCQQQPERRGRSVAARAAAAEVRTDVCVAAVAAVAGQRAAAAKLASGRGSALPTRLLVAAAAALPCSHALFTKQLLPRALAWQVVSAVPFPTTALERFAAELQAAGGQQERSRLLLEYARRLPAYPETARTDAHRVMGCTAQVGGQEQQCSRRAVVRYGRGEPLLCLGTLGSAQPRLACCVACAHAGPMLPAYLDHLVCCAPSCPIKLPTAAPQLARSEPPCCPAGVGVC